MHYVYYQNDYTEIGRSWSRFRFKKRVIMNNDKPSRGILSTKKTKIQYNRSIIL